MAELAQMNIYSCSICKKQFFDKEIAHQHVEEHSYMSIVMIATEEEMKSAKLDMEDRDYCAHILLNYRACRREKFPFVYRCKHEKHQFEECEYEDYVLRMKEYERERRLLARAARKRAKEAKEALKD